MIARLVCYLFGHLLELPTGERDVRSDRNSLLGWRACCPRCGSIVWKWMDDWPSRENDRRRAEQSAEEIVDA